MGSACVVSLILFLAGAAPAQELAGEWFADPAEALGAAAKARKPILAVGIDHG